MAYIATPLSTDIVISNVVTIHYFSYASNFSFPGETHDFWEFVYVDHGEIQICSDGVWSTLSKGQIHFHKPNEFHALKATGEKAPNLVVVAFVCKSKAMKFFEGKTLPVSDVDCSFLRSIIAESREYFANPLNDPSTEQMIPAKHASFGCAQFIRSSLECLMIQLIREATKETFSQSYVLGMTNHENDDALLLQKLDRYFEANIARTLSIKMICKDNFVGYSRLKTLYQKYHHCSLMEYFAMLKIQTAQQMIRDRHLNISEISDALGYSSVGYFSRQFKKKCGMSPSEYASTILAMSEKTVPSTFEYPLFVVG